MRALIFTRERGFIREAYEEFERVHGKGLLEIRIGDKSTTAADVRSARAICAYYTSTAELTHLTPAVQAASQRGAVILGLHIESVSRSWDVTIDAQRNEAANAYWEQGGKENIAAFLAFVYRASGGSRRIEVPPAVPGLTAGIYHPRAGRGFTRLDEYLAWYRAEGRIGPQSPLVGILFYQTNYKLRDLAHIDALVEALEKWGIGAVPIFGWPAASLGPLMEVDGKTPLRLLMALNLGFNKTEDGDLFDRLGLHVIQLLTTSETEAQWTQSARGITPDRLATQVAGPERVGASEPILIASSEPDPEGEANRTRPIQERVDAAARRAQRWIALQDKPNGEKKIAFLYYNNPPGKGNLGASYLAVLPSMTRVLKELEKAGYRVGAPLPTERQLLEMIERSGRNIELWAPGELQDMVEKGGVVLVSMAKYNRWFAQLPRQFRESVNTFWGPPEKSQLMTIAARNGEKFFVIPGIRLGNVFLGPQPLRATFEKAIESSHNMAMPPPHSYVAAYLWYRNEFHADAAIHLGRHGTLEWLPGKAIAQAGWDSSEVLLDDLPNINYYIIDGGGEAIQAKRRSAAVLIGHLTPLTAAGGEQEKFRKLHEALENLHSVQETSPDLAEIYRKQALAEIQATKLDRQLGLQGAEWSDVGQRVESFLQATEAGPIPMGIHRLGELPSESVQQEALAEFFQSGFSDAERKTIRAPSRRWLEALFRGEHPEVDGDLAPALRDKVGTALAESADWLERLRLSPRLELESLITVLSGHFLRSGLVGDPLRQPASLPSGRNLHDFDPSLLPTRAAWELGQTLAEQMIQKYRKEKHEYPAKVSMVLWQGETGRSHGAMEAEALYLMGVEPQWNSRGVVDGLKLISAEALGRPRVDVVFTISGMYRDGLADKVLLLDRAAKLAASAPDDNVLKRHNQEIAAQLKAAGVEAELAGKVAESRVFGRAPGEYGAGISKMVEQSRNAESENGLAELYLRNMGYIYSQDLWGTPVAGAFEAHLAGNQAVIHSRSTNVYGVLDNDDFYEFAGGLNLASKTVNGSAPQFYIDNLRAAGRESVEDFQAFLATELHARFWNPKWIQENQKAGYAGARQVARYAEHLYGWQATSPEKVDESVWQETYDVYVADKNGLEIGKFFDEANPHARQRLLARLLEVDRQGIHRIAQDERAKLVGEYVTSVNAHGVDCSANTCGNLKLNQHVAAAAALVPGLGNVDLRRFGEVVAKATGWSARQFQNAPASLRAGMSAAQALRFRPPSNASRPSAAASRRPFVSGFRMEQKVWQLGTAQPAPSRLPVLTLVILAFVLAGMIREARRFA